MGDFNEMKIAHLCFAYGVSHGGIATYVDRIVHKLSERGISNTVFTISPPSYNEREYGVSADSEISVYEYKPLFRVISASFSSQLTYRMLQSFDDFDIIHLHYPFVLYDWMTYFIKKRSRSRLKMITTYHNDIATQGRIGGILGNAYNMMLGKMALLASDKILATTYSYAKTSLILKNYMDKVDVLPLPVDTDYFRPKIVSKKDVFDVRNEKKTVLFVGTLDPANFYKKGISYLIQALKHTDDETLLVFVGYICPEALNLIKKQSIKIEVNNKILLLGSVSEEILSAVYNASDLLILPSIHRIESFGMPLLEAMACEKPVITTDIPGPSDVVRDIGGGVIIPRKDPIAIADAINKIINGTCNFDFDRTLEVIHNRYSMEHHIDILCKMYAD